MGPALDLITNLRAKLLHLVIGWGYLSAECWPALPITRSTELHKVSWKQNRSFLPSSVTQRLLLLTSDLFPVRFPHGKFKSQSLLRERREQQPAACRQTGKHLQTLQHLLTTLMLTPLYFSCFTAKLSTRMSEA